MYNVSTQGVYFGCET